VFGSRKYGQAYVEKGGDEKENVSKHRCLFFIVAKAFSYLSKHENAKR
jgi:hypothetical protein